MKIFVAFLSLFVSSQLFSANIQKLLQDTQKLSQEESITNMVWWIPIEFWNESLKGNPNLTDEKREELVKALNEYSAFTIVYTTTENSGRIESKSREEVLANIEFKVGSDIIAPLETDDLAPDAAKFFGMMKPMMKRTLGSLGQGMHFIVYPNKKDGQTVLDSMKEGSFEFTSFDQTFKWRLPLGSLLPPMYDKETQEAFPGNYKYNPFTGNELVTEVAE